jgi:hypothetical protein
MSLIPSFLSSGEVGAPALPTPQCRGGSQAGAGDGIFLAPALSLGTP